MAYSADILLGRIIKLSGYKGAVTVKLEAGFVENIPVMESVFLEIEGRPVPFLISDSEYSGADLIKLSFDGYKSLEKITGFVGCRIFLTAIIHQSENSSSQPDLIGFEIISNDGENVGSITEIMFNSGQWLINVLSADRKNILIPFHENFIVSVDKRKKRIIMDLPDGLITIN